MMTDTPRHSEVSRRVAAYLQHRPAVAAALPAPSETWTFREVALDREAHAKLNKHDAIESDGQDRDRDDRQRIHTWRTRPETHAFIQRVVLPIDGLAPCGHSGVRTIEPGECYTCCRDDCEETFGPATAREVLG